MRDSHRRARSGSTPHDHRRPVPLATPLLLASSRAPEQQGDVLARSALLLQAQRSHPPLASSPSKTLVVFVSADNNPSRRPRNPDQRSVRDLQIPIGRARSTSPLPPRGFLLGRLSNAGPASRTIVPQGPASKTLHPSSCSWVGRPLGRNATKNGRSFERNYAGAVTPPVVLTRAGSTPNGRT
jgi:hypothetical protein